jgi:glycosyltransferase 2 family protein
MNKRLLGTVLKYAIGIGLGAGLLYLSFRDIEFSELQAELANLEWIWLVPAFFIGTFAHWLRAARWTMLTRAAGYPTRTWPAFWSLMVGYAANYAVPRLGEITRCTMLSRSQGIPFMSAVGTVVIERVVDVVMLLVFLGLTFLLEFDKLMGYFTTQPTDAAAQAQATSGGVPAWVLYAVLGLLLAGGFGVFVFRRRLLRTKVGARVWAMAQQLIDALLSIRKLKRVWLFVLQSLGIWACYIVVTWIMLFSLPNVVPFNTLLFGFFITMLGAIGMALPSLGGAGTFHVAVIVGFSLYNAPNGQAASIWLHTPQVIISILLGAIGYCVLMLSQRRATKSQRQSANNEQTIPYSPKPN